MFLSEWREFPSAPCLTGKTWWQIASRCCWNRGRSWHVSELVSFLVGLRIYTTNCKHSLALPEDGRNYRPKHVELIEIVIKLLLLHLVGCLYYCAHYYWQPAIITIPGLLKCEECCSIYVPTMHFGYFRNSRPKWQISFNLLTQFTIQTLPQISVSITNNWSNIFFSFASENDVKPNNEFVFIKSYEA